MLILEQTGVALTRMSCCCTHADKVVVLLVLEQLIHPFLSLIECIIPPAPASPSATADKADPVCSPLENALRASLWRRRWPGHSVRVTCNKLESRKEGVKQSLTDYCEWVYSLG